MASLRSRRLAKVEAAVAGLSGPVPHVLKVMTGEDRKAAFARFAAKYPNAPKGNALLVVPTKPETDAEHASFAARFKASQLALVENARRRTEEIAGPALPPSDFNPSRGKPKGLSKIRPWRPNARR